MKYLCIINSKKVNLSFLGNLAYQLFKKQPSIILQQDKQSISVGQVIKELLTQGIIFYKSAFLTNYFYPLTFKN